MSLLTTMLVVLAAMTAAPPAPALPDLPPVELPPLPELPADPPAVPPVTPAPTATPEPVATPGAPEAQTAAAAAPAPEPRPISTPSAPNAESRRRAPPRRPAPRAEARDDVDLASVRELDRRPAPRAADDEPSSSAPGIAGDVIELVEALPHAVLWALLGISGLALGLAGNAYWQSRQREKLEAQRAELLGDIGLLSSALLPAVPDGLDGLAVTAAYRPADGPAAGGDFYDVFPLDGGRLGVLLGDVSGHGRDSLAQAALARYTLRTLLAAGHAPGEALARADRMLHRELPPHFVTVIAAIYDPCGSLLTYAKAGHAPPIVLGAPYHPLAETPACPLGLALGESWPEYSVRIDAGVTVCLYTDGLEDARVAGGRVGREEVVRLLVAQPEPDAVRLLADLGDYAVAICDDTAAVVLRRDQPPAGTAS